MTGLLGGAFDPPHNGHVRLAQVARDRFGLGPLIVLVSARPGHRAVAAPAEARLRMAQAAFPGEEVELDEHPRTVDLLRERRFEDPLFLMGADQFSDFMAWKDPDGVLALARVAVATRPGFPQEGVEHVLEQLDHPERVELFELEPLPIASRDIRALVARGEPIADLVPPAVEQLIREQGLYRG